MLEMEGERLNIVLSNSLSSDFEWNEYVPYSLLIDYKNTPTSTLNDHCWFSSAFEILSNMYLNEWLSDSLLRNLQDKSELPCCSEPQLCQSPSCGLCACYCCRSRTEMKMGLRYLYLKYAH